MSLFACTRCGGVDNTALAPGYWTGARLCTACATGLWHGMFPRRRYTPATDGPLGPGRILQERAA
jgi:hypothetical protein